MNHMGTVEIETERLLLRKFTESDDLAVYNNWTSDEKVTEFLRWPTHNSIDIIKNTSIEKKMNFPLWKQILFGLAGSKYDKLAKKNNQKYNFIFVRSNGKQLEHVAKVFEEK